MPPDPRVASVLCASGQDPSGGAGIAADTEAIRAAGAHALGVITCITAQDTCGLRHLWPQPAEQVEAQCRCILEDARVTAIKIGLLCGGAMVNALAAVLRDRPDLPVVLDPVLATGTGQSLADAHIRQQMRERLIPAVTLLTPNVPEAETLSQGTGPDDCAERLLRIGCPWVLITGTHASTPEVTNRLYGDDGTRLSWSWPRLPGAYHGSGCTLASAIAARLALGSSLPDAVAEAQAYTWQTLARARRTGRCQLTPNRLYALDPDATP